MPTLANKIMRRVRARGKGKWVFSPRDFLALGSRNAVDKALSRLTSDGAIRRVGRGFYDYPRHSALLGKPAPVDMAIAAKAIARHYGIRMMVKGMDAANGLGLTNAVAAKISYATDGPSRDVQIDGRTICLKRVSTRQIAWAQRPGAPVVQALYWLGSATAHNDPHIPDILGRRLPDPVKRDLVDGLHLVPAWMVPILRKTISGAEAVSS